MMKFDGWDDITPIAQDDSVDCVVSIVYDKEYKALMGIFRAVVQIQEKSERVLNLTAEILKENAASYTVWQYRRECLLATGIDLNIELDYLDNFSNDNPKNYQIWHHRRVIVENMKHVDRELEFCDKVFSVDCKNYHAWAHRQWAVKTYSLWNGELAYVDKLLTQDIRNNSAWNHRWFIFHHGPILLDSTAISSEMGYTFDRITTVQLNESAWNYLRGWVNIYYYTSDNTKQGKVVVVESMHIMAIMKFCADLLYRDIVTSSSPSSSSSVPVHSDRSSNYRECDDDDDDGSSHYEDCNDESEDENNNTGDSHIKQQAHQLCETTASLETSGISSEQHPQKPSSTANANTTANFASMTATSERIWNPFALSLLADLREKENTIVSLSDAKSYFQRLIIIDSIRAKAWKLRVQRVEDQIADHSV